MAEADVSGAKAVLQRFVDAGLARDEGAMRACLTQSSLGGGFNPDSGPPPGSVIQLGEPVVESESAVLIPVLGQEPGGGEFQPVLQALVVKENGEWKVDLATSIDRMMSGMMSNVTESLGGMMEGVGDVLSNALEAFGGSEEEEEEQDWSEAQLKPKRSELLPMPKMTKLPKLSAALSEAVGSPVVAEAAMDDLLMGDQSQFQMLMDWFEGPLFAAWPGYLKAAMEYNPLKGKLRALRLEAAGWHDQRCLVLDGSDLVYRMRLPETEGFYQDDEVEGILAGVLAGLPDKIDKTLVGKRTILNDEETGDLEVYKERVVPAYMRRISELLGKQVQLRVDWDEGYLSSDAVRQFQRWGINRVFGAIAMLCNEPEWKTYLSENFEGIELVRTSILSDRHAKYEDGWLTLSFHDYGGEPAGFYEQTLYGVITGEPIVSPGAAAMTSEDAHDNAEEPALDALSFGETSDASQEMTAEVGTDGTSEVDEFEELRRQQEADAATRATRLNLGEVEMRVPSGEEIEAKKRAKQAERELNDENFRTALTAMRETEPTWEMQASMLLGGGPVKLEIDWDGLQGKFELIQPMVHRAVVGTLEGLGRIAFDTDIRGRLSSIRKVQILGIDGTGIVGVWSEVSKLVFQIPLEPRGERPPIDEIANKIKWALGVTPPEAKGSNAPADNPPDGEDYRPPSVDRRDKYEAASAAIVELEAAMKRNGMWPFQDRPANLEVRGAFGAESMPFVHWLAWVLIPRVQQIVETRGEFPAGSQVGAYAVRELDGVPGGDEIVSILSDFDAIFSRSRPRVDFEK